MNVYIAKRFPSLSEILPVYAAITFLEYSWTIINIFWKLPSWLNFLGVGEIGAIVAYSLMNALIESMVVLALVLILSILLPEKFIRSNFILRGTILVYLFTFWVALFDITFAWFIPSLRDVLTFAIAGILISGLLFFLLRKAKFISCIIILFGDRLIVLLYIWLPLGIIGLCVVLTRIIVLNLLPG
jgi:hypothetical protein